MSTHTLFEIVNTGILPFWLLLVIYPSWKYRNTIIYLGAGALAASYLVLMLAGEPMDFSDFGSLEGVMGLFTIPEAVLIGWIHYLAFDLLIGNWIVNESQRLEIKHWFIIPILFLTLMFGPVGFLVFLIIKTSKIKRVD